MSTTSAQNDSLIGDYYTFFNISSNATDEEIKAAYRRLSKIYHPDKHAPEGKKEAQKIFNDINKAYDVLIDPHKRAIYDTLGVKGLETEGLQIVKKVKTPQEVREEFERLQKEQEERLLQQRTNHKGSIGVVVNVTDLFEQYDYKRDWSLLPSFELTSVTINQSLDAPLNIGNTAHFAGNVSARNGIGTGTVSSSLQHVFSNKTSGEFQITIGQGPLVGFKLFRNLNYLDFIIANTFLHFGPNSIKPGYGLVYCKHLSKTLVGYITWKGGIQNMLNTTLIWNNGPNQVISQVQLGLPTSFASLSCARKFSNNNTELIAMLKLGTFGALIEYGCDTQLSKHSIIGASVRLGVPTGVTLKLRLKRANQNFVFSFLLAEDLIPAPIFYGTITPVLTYLCIKSLVIDPYQRKEKEKEMAKNREKNALRLSERKSQAESEIALMKQTYERIIAQEVENKGLIILEAFYGNDSSINCINKDSNCSRLIEIIDVKIPLQCLVIRGSLRLSNASKVNLPGFYDPCLGTDKSLYIRYKYREDFFEIIKTDREEVKLPEMTIVND